MYPTSVGVNVLLDRVDHPARYANLLIVLGQPVLLISPVDAPIGPRFLDRLPRLFDQLRDRIRL